MTRYQPTIAALAERLRRKELSRLVYFHTDHFEPWTEINGAPAVGQETVDRVGEFVDTCNRIDYARRLTLFYKPHLNYGLREGDDLIRADPGDLIGFYPSEPDDEYFGKAAMGNLVANSGHEIQVHIHHEYYTSNHGHFDPESIAYFAKPGAGDLDGRRLELAIRLNREIITRETGLSLDRWFFVHGQWALNASDDEACRITREIEILMQYGCLGDFTFPAGRPQVDPQLTYPYFCKPVNARKGYDTPAAEPETAWGNARAAREKFFIWASAAKAAHCSIDYFSDSTRRRLDNVERSAIDLVDLSYQTAGRLFIKTHAHSVHPSYFEHVRTAVYPHEYPATQSVMSVLFDAAALAGMEVEFLTASEIYDLFVNANKVKDPARVNGHAAAKPIQIAMPVAKKPQRDAPRTLADFAIPLNPGAIAGSPLEFVREVASQTLRRRVEEHGVKESGAYRHYWTMLDAGMLIPRYEQVIAETLAEFLPPMTACHEIGSGIGTLPFLLAMTGFTAIGIEHDRRRHTTAQAILDDMAKLAPLVTTRCRLINEPFPQAIRDMDVSQSIAILSDFVSTQSPEQFDLIIAGLRRYRYVLLDLQRFCERRPDRAEQMVLLEDLVRRGFDNCIEVIDLDIEGHYCLFENTPSAVARDGSVATGGIMRKAVARLFSDNR